MILKIVQTGELWGDAHTYAQPRRMGCGEDPRVPGEQPGTEVSSREPAGDLRLDSSHAGGAGVFPSEEKGAWFDPRLPAQGDRAELGSVDAVDPAVPARGRPEGSAQNAAQVSHHLHAGRRGAIGRNRPAASTLERTGDAVPVRTRREAVWRFQV